MWAFTSGDLNAFFGLMLDNVAGLLLMTALLAGFGLPAAFTVTHMVPGTALGVMLGDIAFFFIALRMAKRENRSDVTAMPLGLDTPSTFGMILLVLGPAFLAATASGMSELEAARHTWHIGIWCTVLSGVLKLVLAPFGQIVRDAIPRAGLLGSLAAIALVLISFFPLTHILGSPLPGLLALVIVLGTLIGHLPLPGRTPGTLGALIVAGSLYYFLCLLGVAGYELPDRMETVWFPTQWMESWQGTWWGALPDALPFLPFVLPFALATVVGGIDCTESAASAGDEYDARTVLGVEAAATFLAGLSGGVIQTTPYIGHPAYKAMGGRATYTLATALLVGSAGIVGYFAILNAWIPAPAVYPILVFVGLEITSQTFLATPRKHYAAVVIACLPALAYLAMSLPDRVFGDSLMLDNGYTMESLGGDALKHDLQTLRMISNGFIITGLLWSWALASMIDRKLLLAGGLMIGGAVLTFFGVMHSPIEGNRMFVPFAIGDESALGLPEQYVGSVMEFVEGYLVTGLFLIGWSFFVPNSEPRGEVADQH
ncbi:permease [Rhodopirellula halodulae]|uniref:permease n=1 Tax=Rhodopirellula halodulae TaxID=2894198 RepID=UPI001E494A54|nr:permease [Rhodopirellula sp. JC737]MCC9655803.1 permease [Rhodopirellula sp. JC737]